MKSKTVSCWIISWSKLLHTNTSTPLPVTQYITRNNIHKLDLYIKRARKRNIAPMKMFEFSLIASLSFFLQYMNSISFQNLVNSLTSQLQSVEISKNTANPLTPSSFSEHPSVRMSSGTLKNVKDSNFPFLREKHCSAVSLTCVLGASRFGTIFHQQAKCSWTQNSH